jgi:RimJ/RimL family protein N-acetyltransferase
MDFDKAFKRLKSGLETHRMNLRPVDHSDFDDLAEIFNDPAAVRFDSVPISTVGGSWMANSLKGKIDLWINGSYQQKVLVLGFRLKGSNKLIGFRFLEFFTNGMVYTEIKINRSFRKQGFATEGSEAIFALLLRCKAFQIFSTVHKDNTAAISLDKKINLKEANPDYYPVDISAPDAGDVRSLIEFYPVHERKVFTFFQIQSEAFTLFGKGNQARRSKNLQTAKRYFERSLELAPRYIYAIDQAGWCALDLNSPREAEVYFRKAIGINKYFTNSILGLGYALADTGKIIEAVNTLLDYLEIEKQDDETFVYMGTLLYNIRQFNQARTCFERALEINPRNQEARNSLTVMGL